MTEINMRLDRSRYKVWELIKIQDGDTNILLDVMARMLLQPGSAQYYPKTEDAKAVILDLDGEVFDALQIQFYAALSEARQAALPPGLKGR